MLSLLLPLVCAAPSSGVVIGTNVRASTVTVSPMGKPNSGPGGTPALEVMLTDVISPRVMQRRAAGASQFTLDVALGEAVTIEPRAPDELTKKLGQEEGATVYGRLRIGKLSLHEALLQAGWAWVLPGARQDKALVKLEGEARAAKRGLWADESPVEPWLWREVLMMSDVEGNVLHAGWECPHVQQTQCKNCKQQRFFSLEEASAAGFTPHAACMTGDVLRSAQASGEVLRVRLDDGTPVFPVHARRSCKTDRDCALSPPAPCTCPGCGTVWREAARLDVVKRMKTNFARATCDPVGCPACAAREVGTRAVCREAQCTADQPEP